MAPPGPLRVMSHGGRRFLCFCGDGGASPRLQLTDACEFWSCSVPSQKLNGQEEPGSAAHSLSRLREILQGQTPVLTLHDGKATLQVQDGGQSVTFDLAKASLPEARRQLQDLTFGLVEQLQMLEKRLEGAAERAQPLSPPWPSGAPKRSHQARVSWEQTSVRGSPEEGLVRASGACLGSPSLILDSEARRPRRG